jgi:hypothetical protein
VIEVRDHLGRLALHSADTIHAHLAFPTGHTLRGDTMIVAVGGEARFPGILDGPGPLILPPGSTFRTIEFTAPGLRPVTVTVGDSNPTPRLFWRRVAANGVLVDPTRDTVTVRAGEMLQLDVALDYDSPCSHCGMVLAGTPTWPGPRQGLYRIGVAIATPARRSRAETSFKFPVPDRPGVWYIVMAIGEESGSEFLMSSTNWKAQRPRWNDGADVADITPIQIESAARSGTATFDWDISDTPYSDTLIHTDRVRRVPRGVALGIATMVVRIVR